MCSRLAATNVTPCPLLQPLRLTPVHTLRPAGQSICLGVSRAFCALLFWFRTQKHSWQNPQAWGLGAVPSADVTVWDWGFEDAQKLGISRRTLLGFYSSPAGVCGNPQWWLPGKLVKKDKEAIDTALRASSVWREDRGLSSIFQQNALLADIPASIHPSHKY